MHTNNSPHQASHDQAIRADQLFKQAEADSHSGRWDEAIKAWRELEEIQPHHPDAADEAAHLIVARARRKAGLSSNDPLHAEDKSAASDDTAILTSRRGHVALRLVKDVPFPTLPAAAMEMNRSPLQQLEHAYRECPTDTEVALHLARMYVETEREYPAEQLLDKHFKTADKTARVQSALEEVQMFRIELKISAAREALLEDQTPEAKETLEKHLAEQDRLETRIFRARCDREPTNAALQLELGRRLARGEKLIDAARYFAKAVNDPQLGPTAAWEAGKCSQRLGELPEALHFYRQAAAGARLPGHEAAGTAALVAAAGLVKKLKLEKLALRYLNELLKIAPQHEEGLELQQQWRKSDAVEGT